MDIRCFFETKEAKIERKNDPEEKEKDVFKKFRAKLADKKKDNVIDLLTMEQIINFVTEGGPLTKMGIINNLIEGKGLDALIKKIIPHYLDSRDGLKQIINEMYTLPRPNPKETWKSGHKAGIREIFNFLYDKDATVFGLYGYAGTGKTTLITAIIHFLYTKKIIHKIAMT